METDALLALLRRESERFLAAASMARVAAADPGASAAAFCTPLPEAGLGTMPALEALVAAAAPGLVTSLGPRFFHLVVGGVTEAARGADWLTGLWDQVAASTLTSPAAVFAEERAVAWLRALFGLPPGAGVLTTGGHGANLIGLLAARQWWGERHGVDVAEDGITGLPPMPVFSSGLVHASAVKALAQLGLGRKAVQRLQQGPTGALDAAALRAALAGLGGAPAVLIGNAGDVNSGAFDDLERLADLAQEFGAWLHVDGAFGLFARCSPRTAPLARGVERAQSIASDCHKWLNVPYDCGVGFVADKRLLVRANKLVADYLPRDAGPGQVTPGQGAPAQGGAVLSNLSSESSRRARGFTVWTALLALGRDGVRALVERSLDRANELAAAVDAHRDLERLAPVALNVVCFRAFPSGARRRDLDALNERVSREVLRDGRVFIGSTRYGGRVALRAAFVNHATEPDDVRLAIAAVTEAIEACGGSAPDHSQRRTL